MTWNKISTADWPTPEELLARKARGETWTQMAAQLGTRRKRLCEYVEEELEVVGQTDVRPDLIRRNAAFEAALMAAIELGLERAPIGVYKDPTPHPTGRLTLGDAVFSGCGSQAALCVEYADPKW